jgi:hypothetical protein
MPVFIREHRKILHRLHISPTGQRFPRAWDVDVPPRALSAALEALTVSSQLVRILVNGEAEESFIRSLFSKPSSSCLLG